MSSGRSPSVLHILPSAASGGGPSVVRNFIAASTWRNFVVMPNDHPENFAEFRRAAAGVHDLPVRRLRPDVLAAIVRVIRRERIDVVHSHGRAAGVYGRSAAMVTGRVAAHTFHGWHLRASVAGRLGLVAEYVLARATDLLIAVSESERAALAADGVAPAHRIHVLHNPVALPKGAPHVSLALEAGVRHVVSLSRQSPQKDLHTLVGTAALLGPGYHLHVFGGVLEDDQAYAAAVRARIADEGVRNVTLHGDVPNAAGLLPRFDAYLSCARWEGLPTAVIEAFMAGIPVVATDCVGNFDLVHDEVTGLLRPAGNAQALADAVREVCEDGNLARRLIENGRELAARFSPAVAAERQHRLYSDRLR